MRWKNIFDFPLKCNELEEIKRNVDPVHPKKLIEALVDVVPLIQSKYEISKVNQARQTTGAIYDFTMDISSPCLLAKILRKHIIQYRELNNIKTRIEKTGHHKIIKQFLNQFCGGVAVEKKVLLITCSKFQLLTDFLDNLRKIFTVDTWHKVEGEKFIVNNDAEHKAQLLYVTPVVVKYLFS